MKLRLKDNSIRIRLTRPEVENLDKEGMLLQIMETNSVSGRNFGYSIEKSSDTFFSVQFDNDVLRLLVPGDVLTGWAVGDEVSLEGTDGRAQILVEKDFACLKPRSDENEADYFPNPNAAQAC